MFYVIIIIIMVFNVVIWCADNRISVTVILQCHVSRRVPTAPTKIQTKQITSPKAIKSKLKNSVNVDCAQKKDLPFIILVADVRFSRKYNFDIIFPPRYIIGGTLISRYLYNTSKFLSI